MRRGPGRRKPNAADRAAAAKRELRRADTLALRVAGKSFREIAREQGLSLAQVHEDYQRVCAERPAESLKELRAFGNEALEAVLEGHLEAARRGDEKSANVVVKAIAQHAKINGYEAPKKIDLGGQVSLGPTIFIPGEEPRTHLNGSNGAGASSGGLATEFGTTNGVPSPDDR